MLQTFSNEFLWIKIFLFWFKLYSSLLLVVRLAIDQHWFRQWIGNEQVTNHYLNQTWPILLTNICVIRFQQLKLKLFISQEVADSGTNAVPLLLDNSRVFSLLLDVPSSKCPIRYVIMTCRHFTKYLGRFVICFLRLCYQLYAISINQNSVTCTNHRLTIWKW